MRPTVRKPLTVLRTRALRTTFCGALLLLLPCLAAGQTTGQNTPALGTVHWADGRLTVQAVNAPLKELVEEVARRTGVTVSGADRLSGWCACDFRDMPLAGALPLLLEHVNYIITTEGGNFHLRIHSMAKSAAEIVAGGPIHIPGLTDRTPGEKDAVDDAGVDIDVEEDEEQREELDTLDEMAEVGGPRALAVMESAMQSEYLDVRLRALQLLSRRKEPAALPVIIEALADDEVDVALTASDLLAAMPGVAVLDALVAQLRADVTPDAQLAALRALALRADPASLLNVRRAVQAVDPLVRDYAAALVKELESRAAAAANRKG